MNLVNIWRNALPVQKAVALLTIAAFALMPLTSVDINWAFADHEGYLISSLGSPSVVGTVVTINGNSSAHYQTGANNTQHMAVDWDEDQDGDPTTGVNWKDQDEGDAGSGMTFNPTFTDHGQGNRSFTATWQATHDYSSAGPGTYLVSVIVYHGNTPGEDGDAQNVIEFEIVIPPDPTTGTLEVIKTVINDDSGTSTASDFTLNVTGPESFSESDPGSESGTMYADLTPGEYTITEDAFAGYTADFSQCGTEGVVSVTAGATTTCTVVNDDNGPATGEIVVVKTVVNDSETGTSTVSDFDLFVGQTQVTSGATTTVSTGNHVVTETGPSGYTAIFGGACDAQGNVTVIENETVTCTIENNDVDPNFGSITFEKAVADNDITEWSFDFTSTFGDFTLSNATTSIVFSDLEAGNYMITELIPDDWVLVQGSTCSSEGVTAFFTPILNDNDEPIGIGIDLPQGEIVNCIFINGMRNSEGDVVVIKEVINDSGTGTSVVEDFTLMVGSTTVASGATTTVAVGSYVVSESGPGGYDATFGGDCDANGNVMVVEGETAVCTITNNDIPREPSGSSGGSGGVVNRGDDDDDDSGDDGEVLGDSTVIEIEDDEPEGEVLPATVGLPVTGAGGSASDAVLPMLIVGAIASLAVVRRKLVLQR